MKTLIGYVEDIIGTWDPITEAGAHFFGVDFRYLVAAAVLVVVLIGFFNIVRAVVRSR